MKELLIKILKFLGKVLLKLFKILIYLPYEAYKLGKTYDMEEFEENIEYIKK